MASAQGTSHETAKRAAACSRDSFDTRSATNGKMKYRNASTDNDQLGPFHACASGVHDCNIKPERTALKINVWLPCALGEGSSRYLCVATGKKSKKAKRYTGYKRTNRDQ